MIEAGRLWRHRRDIVPNGDAPRRQPGVRPSGTQEGKPARIRHDRLVGGDVIGKFQPAAHQATVVVAETCKLARAAERVGERRRQHRQELQLTFDACFERWRHAADDHGVGWRQPRAVRLGRKADVVGHLVERETHVLETAAPVRLDHFADLRQRRRMHPVRHRRQVRAEARGYDIRSGREETREAGEHGPEIGQDLQQFCRRPLGAGELARVTARSFESAPRILGVEQPDGWRCGDFERLAHDWRTRSMARKMSATDPTASSAVPRLKPAWSGLGAFETHTAQARAIAPS